MPLLSQEGLERLLAAREEARLAISDAYDESICEVTARIDQSGSIGKVDVGALLLWKRLQANTPWASELNAMPDAQIRKTTAEAVADARDESLEIPEAASRGRRALSSLPGFVQGDALASALLFAAAPGRMAVYDSRAQTAIERLGLELTSKPGRYGRYMRLVEQLAQEAGAASGQTWIPRDVDLALYWLGA